MAATRTRAEGGKGDAGIKQYASLIPPNARNVVEFGCGDGTLGRLFKRIQPDCRYVGIDTEEDALRLAAGILDQVAMEPMETLDFRRHGIFRADCIVYHGHFLPSDGLARRLRAHAELLPDCGQMIFLLDHPGYFRNWAGLLAGEAPRASAGVRREELLAALEEAGLHLDGTGALSMPSDDSLRQDPATLELLDACRAYCKARGISMEQDPWARQHVVRAVKQPARRMRLTVLLAEPVCAPVRMRIPNQFCVTAPGVSVHEMELSEEKEDIPKREDLQQLYIYQRFAFPSLAWGDAWLKDLRRKDILVAMELDDCPLRWKQVFDEHKYLELVGCHAIQTSTRPLAEFLAAYNPHVWVFENQLRQLPPMRRWDMGNRDVTIFFGALNRTEDWQDIMPVLNEAIGRYGDRLRFKVTADRAFFDALRTGRKEYVGELYDGKFASYPRYAEAMSQSDIALLPLKDNEFNRMKSDLKFIECAAHGAVVLASPTVYERTVRDGRTGMLYRDPQEFRACLDALVGSRELRRDLAEAAYRYVREHRLLSQHYEERLAAYREMLARREELERDCQARVERLGL